MMEFYVSYLEKIKRLQLEAGVPDDVWHERLYGITDLLNDAVYNLKDNCEFYDEYAEPTDRADYATALIIVRDQLAKLIQHMDTYEAARHK